MTALYYITLLICNLTYNPDIYTYATLQVANMKSRIEELTAERDCLRQRLDEIEESHKRKMKAEKQDIAIERETYETSRHGLNEMYLSAKEKLTTAYKTITDLERAVEIEKKIKVHYLTTKLFH